MLMRRFLSMTEFSQQGFEASHKDQRQLWLKATSHDQHGEASSSKCKEIANTDYELEVVERVCVCV